MKGTVGVYYRLMYGGAIVKVEFRFGVELIKPLEEINGPHADGTRKLFMEVVNR